MKTVHRGYEIDVRRDRSLGGDKLLYYSIFRVSDGREGTSGFTSGSETVREYLGYMKERVDAELAEADPWGWGSV